MNTTRADDIDPRTVLARVRDQVEPALRGAVERLTDARMRAVAGYHFGWLDAEGHPAEGSAGKAMRPALVVLGAQAAGGTGDEAIAPAVAVELVHNFSLLHDDIMDRDVERRHRPTGWVVFGEGQAILAGNAMLTLAIDELLRSGAPGRRALPLLLDSVQILISGQSADLALEQRATVTLDEVLEMEAGKTASLMSCAAAIGALASGADEAAVAHLAAFGSEIGMAFQLVDDVLGIVGDSAATGKSSSSDIRAGKRSAPIVAALGSGTDAGERLAALFGAGPPTSEDDVALAAKLVDEAGGLEWATSEARRRFDRGLAELAAVGSNLAVAELEALARYVVERDR
jgi:geranylgeranyl diphosphate synthase type I